MSQVGSIHLPNDEWSHPHALHEWWYINAHLSDGGGREFAVFLAFFPDYLIFSLADKMSKRMITKSRINGNLHADSSGIHFDRNSLTKLADRHSYEVIYRSDDVSLELELTPRKGPLIVNGNGKIKEGLLGTSWYYALTDLTAEGRFNLAGRELGVKGIGWIDRQWGGWEDMGIGSWVWFSLQLSNGCEILATEIYSPIFRGSSTKVLSIKGKDQREAHTSKFQIRQTEFWNSKISGSRYGRKWLLESPSMLRLEIEVDFDDQEIHRGLWEGSCFVQGTYLGDSVKGVGFSEQVDRSPGFLLGLLTLSAAPFHFITQNLLGRANLGLWDLADRLRVWKVLKTRN